jgi:hypothetical protein
VDARSVLGLQPLRPPFLDHVSAAEPRQTKADHGDHVVTTVDILRFDYVLDDDDDIDEDEEDDDFDENEDGEDGEDDEEEDDEDIETWQVSQNGRLP